MATEPVPKKAPLLWIASEAASPCAKESPSEQRHRIRSDTGVAVKAEPVMQEAIPVRCFTPAAARNAGNIRLLIDSQAHVGLS